MVHYEQLQKRLTHLVEWSRTRKEQGAQGVDAVIKTIDEKLTHALLQLEGTQPSEGTQRHEPNDLESIKALRPEGPRVLKRTYSEAELRDRLAGAFLGRCAGCTLGAAVEFWSIQQMRELAQWNGTSFPPVDYWLESYPPLRKRYNRSQVFEYTRNRMQAVPADDDIAYTLLGLLILEEFSKNFTTEDVGKAWLKYLPMACTAEEIALENLKNGVAWDQCGEMNNPFMEWIGADIRSDPWAYAFPGQPEKAAEAAYKDAYLSHRYSGIYGEMFFAAAISAAFAVDDAMKALEIGLTEIPKECRTARHIKWALDLAPKLNDWEDARRLADEKFPKMSRVHTDINACLTIFGLALGKKDFTKVIGWTVAMGHDNDCTAATAGSLIGAIIGKNGLPAHWYQPFGDRIDTYLKGNETMSIEDVLERFYRIAMKG
ncbi:ADP-ribosylglycohydrolase family protein [candidate division KSB1 bacterium]|nr:ADP-ribosylglycohydrolase family protein [candidate division KSB1 bacterium]